MPSTWELTIESDPRTTLNPERIHALASTWFDTDQSHHDPIKPYSTRPPTPLVSGLHTLRLGLLDDSQMGPFSEKVNRNGGAIQLGKMPAKVIRSRLVQHVTWDELADRAQPVEVIALRFTSPTLFRAEQEHHTNISALNVFRHFQTRWQKYFGRSPHCPVANQPIVISRRDTIPSAVRFRDTTWTGFIGAVDFDIGLMPPEQRAALDACAGLAPFAGCGAYTTAGFGATDRATHDW